MSDTLNPAGAGGGEACPAPDDGGVASGADGVETAAGAVTPVEAGDVTAGVGVAGRAILGCTRQCW